ncbi:MAG: tyrosine-type recombinase/integrase [Clostridia bacterium]|nr:tyrosine-type recombinase/integrase [Clostridia bacterium]
MKRILETKKLQEFEVYLRNEERSAATIEKYMHDIRFFASFIYDAEISKQTVLDYKSKLGDIYAVASANSMIAALNCFLRFCGWQDLCVKQFKMQRNIYCSEEKELSRAEYIRLLEAANAKHNERLNLIIQTICGTGIRVSELQYITVEAVQHGEAIVNCKGKNRRIFIVPELKKKLLRYARKQGMCAGTVFVTRRGKPVSRHSIWKDMKALCEQANVPSSKVFPHNLRHLFARSFYSIEKDIAKLADSLGHASINTTRIYIVTTGAEHKRKMEHMRLII